jgi:tripartite-type tricarboxylate transporter receptor subunit TctC
MIFARAFAVFAAFALLSGAAAAQTYPDHPITLLVPFPPGGATDAIARIIQEPLQKSLGQPIVVENIGGAGGMIAADKAARATPDGYTILIHQVALAAGMALYPNLNFDAEKNFVTIGLINTSASTLAGRPTLPANNFAELLRWMKEPGQNIKIGHAGVGSYAHLAGVLIAQELGVKVTQVPYRGAGPALVDLLSGEVDLESQSAVVSGQLVRDGKLKAFAVIGRNRFAGLPDLPTMGELGYKKLDIDFWHMLLAPTGTPRPIIDKLNGLLRRAMGEPAFREALLNQGVVPEPSTPEETKAAILQDYQWNADMVQRFNIKAID